VSLLRQSRFLATIARTHRIAFSGAARLSPWVETRMATINRQELERLERRELQLTIMAAVFVFVLASGLAVFMYPLVFVHPDTANRWTFRVAFFGFCALTVLFIGYLLERQSTVRKLKQQILEELERNIELRLQASTDLLQTMPDVNHFWDRLTMEYRRAMTMQKNLTLLLVRAKVGAASNAGDNASALGDAAKAMSRKLRPTDSIYHLAPDLFGLVLPETDTLNAKRIAVRLQEELQSVRAKHGGTFETTVHNYPEHAQSAHELEDIVKSMLPVKEDYAAPVPAPAKA
jgi:GGDEF domain-containing protein